MNLKSTQKGVVLVICLLLLLVISIVGLSSISTTKLEEQMASNAQVKNVSFQAAEATLEIGLDDTQFLGQALNNGINPVAKVNLQVPNGDTRVSTSEVNGEFIQEVWPEGQEAASINCDNPIVQLHYQLDGTAELANANARSVHVQGAFLSAPGECF